MNGNLQCIVPQDRRVDFRASVWFWNLVMAFLILLGTRIHIFTFSALAIGAVGILVFDNSRIVSIMTFILPFSTIFKMPGGTSFLTYLELLFAFMYFVKKNFKCSREEIGIVLFVAFLIVNQCLHGMLNLTVTLKFFSYLILLTALVNERFEDDNKTFFLCYITGFITSSFVRLLDGTFFRIAPYVEMKLERLNGTNITRFSGLYADPNYYVVNLILSMVLVLILFGQKRVTFLQAFIFLFPLIIFTAMTGSKSGFLMLAVVTVFFLYQCYMNRHYFLCVVGLVLVTFVSISIFAGEIDAFSNVLARFKSGNAGLTSGRAENKWSLYITYFAENPLRLFFGRSIAFFDLDGSAAHNTYIDLLYEMGIIGTAWLLLIITNSRNSTVMVKRNFLNYSVFLVILAMYFFLSELQYFDPPFHIALGIITLNMDLRGVFLVNCQEVHKEMEET